MRVGDEWNVGVLRLEQLDEWNGEKKMLRLTDAAASFEVIAGSISVSYSKGANWTPTVRTRRRFTWFGQHAGEIAC